MFEDDKTVYIGPKVHDGIHGYHLVSLLVRAEGGSPILVNRGFISSKNISEAARQSDQEQRELVGFLRIAPVKYWSTPENSPNENRWFWLDTSAITRHFGGGSDEVFLEEIFQGDPGEVKLRLSKGIPIGRAPTVEFRNTHATYAFIW